MTASASDDILKRLDEIARHPGDPEKDALWISLIIARNPGSGDFSKLVKNIEAAGLKVFIPTPFAHMAAILERWGFRPQIMPNGVEAWSRPPGDAK